MNPIMFSIRLWW